MERVRTRIEELGGSSIFLTLTDVDADAQAQFVDGFRSQSAKEYAEIVEECDAGRLRSVARVSAPQRLVAWQWQAHGVGGLNPLIPGEGLRFRWAGMARMPDRSLDVARPPDPSAL